MESPFRDDREAAHMRSAQLAEENEQLRGELAEAKKPKVPPAPGPPRRVLVGALVGGIVALSVLAGAAIFLFRRGPPTDTGPMSPLPLVQPPPGTWVSDMGGMIAPPEKEHIAISWSFERSRTKSTLRAVWTNGHDAYAVGEGGTILYRAPNRIAASAWSSLPSGTTANLNGVSDAPLASTQVDSVMYAVGEHGTILRRADTRSTWVVERSGTSENLHAVIAFAGRLLVVGSGGTVLARDSKGTWKPSVSGTKEALNGLAVASGGQLYAVGDKGTILAADQNLHWTAQQSGTTEDFRAIVSVGEDLFAVGGRGTILRAPGVGTAPWAREPSDGLGDLFAACGGHGRYDARGSISPTGPTDFVLAVGMHGVGLVDDLHAKRGFEASTIVGGADLYAVSTSRTDAFTVGTSGTILHGVLEPIGNEPR